MPCKNTIKTYVKDGIYHIYNRGVDKRNIFLDHQDYKVFLRFLKEALSPPLDLKVKAITVSLKGSTFKGIPRQPKNMQKKIQLLCYCLMPNHFHLLIKQKTERAIKEFMHSITTRYSIYFNKKNDRVGSLFQGIYKAVLIEKEAYLLHLSRYIHRNPIKFTEAISSTYSSYADYLKLRNTKWINTDLLLSFFKTNHNELISIPKNINSYKNFVEFDNNNDQNMLGRLIIEDTR